MSIFWELYHNKKLYLIEVSPAEVNMPLKGDERNAAELIEKMTQIAHDKANKIITSK